MSAASPTALAVAPKSVRSARFVGSARLVRAYARRHQQALLGRGKEIKASYESLCEDREFLKHILKHHPQLWLRLTWELEAYLEAAVEAGFGQVRLIHGRGTGFQRGRVQGIVAGHPDVESFADAPPERGGWGATVVVLKRRA